MFQQIHILGKPYTANIERKTYYDIHVLCRICLELETLQCHGLGHIGWLIFGNCSLVLETCAAYCKQNRINEIQKVFTDGAICKQHLWAIFKTETILKQDCFCVKVVLINIQTYQYWSN